MDFAKLVGLISNTRETRYIALSSNALLVWDYLILLESEVIYIWEKPSSWSKFLYIWNTYMPFIPVLFDNIILVGGAPTDKLCLVWYRFQGYTGWVCNISVEVILQMRIAAMHGLDPHIVVPMVVLFILQAAGMIAIVIWQWALRTAKAHPAPGVNICIADEVPPKTYIYWAVNLSFEAALFLLAIAKAVEHIRMQHTFRGAGVLEVLIKDSILYFAVMMITYILNMITWLHSPTSLFQFGISMAIVLRSRMGCRLLLNIRKAYYDGPNINVPSSRQGGVLRTGSSVRPEDWQRKPVESVELSTITHVDSV